jgi:hypothetical protein
MQTTGKSMIPAMRILPLAAALGICAATAPFSPAQSERLYTQPEAADTGGISGSVDGAKLTHAIAVDQRLKKVYLATLANGGASFSFEKLPVGKYDLLLVTASGTVYEGVAMEGVEPEKADAKSAENLRTRIAKADSFLNKHRIHRVLIGEKRAVAFVERIRDAQILKQSGEELRSNLRRFEIVELEKAADDWQMINSRHIYREEMPKSANSFSTHHHLEALGGVRVVKSVKALGAIRLPESK